MEILGDLIRLEGNGYLPLAWSVRSPLGFEGNTGASVFLTAPQVGQNRVPDIILTPLTPQYFQESLSLEIVATEEKGAVSKVLGALSKVANVVIFDTITVEGRKQHRINLVVEPVNGHPDGAKFRLQLEKALSSISPVPDFSIKPVYSAHIPLRIREPMRIEDAYVKWNGWRDFVLKEYARDAQGFDLDRLVVSTNPEHRLLRYVIPRKGVLQVQVPHNNAPGAVSAITGAMRDQGYNILSSRLSRSPPPGRTERMSVFVAVCEPDSDRSNPQDLQAAILNIPEQFIVGSLKINDGRIAPATRYVFPRRSRVVLAPDDLVAKIKEERDLAIQSLRRDRPKSRKPALVFVSYRFVRSRTADQNIVVEHETSLECIRHAILEAGGQVLEAPERVDTVTTREAIYPRLWAADACLVFAFDEAGLGTLSPSQCLEYGFFMGQAKHARLLVETRRYKDSSGVGNLDGFMRIQYEHAGGRVPKQSIDHTSLYMKVYDFVRMCVREQQVGNTK